MSLLLILLLCALAGLLAGATAGLVAHVAARRRLERQATLVARQGTSNVRVIPPDQVKGPWRR